jgi:ABC-2 type transport system permease protein
MSTMSHIQAVARREARVRIRTRTFVLGTAFLVFGVVAIALVPVIVQYVEGNATQRVAVYVGASDLGTDPAPTLRALLNATPSTGAVEVSPSTHEAVTITTVNDLAAARAEVTAGRTNAVLAIERGPDAELVFTLYTNDPATGRTAQLIGQAASAVAVADRLDRLGVAPADQAALFGPATYAVKWPDPTRTEPTQDSAAMGSSYLLAFGITLLIFMMIVLYGNWVAMSVVEEKSSRVMEVILNAATPFELLGGKVLGVGAAAALQYLAILVAGGLALVLQDRVAAAVLGSSAGVSLPEGLTITLLVLFCVYGVLGFLLYAVLYAAAGSLVSRQEDVNGAVMPMTMVTLVGYMIAVYAATGLLDIRAGWVAILSQVPFISPFLMPSRIAAGDVSGWEVALSIAILLVTIPAALWIAARVYAAGVLLYGQRPSMRAVWRLMRSPG